MGTYRGYIATVPGPIVLSWLGQHMPPLTYAVFHTFYTEVTQDELSGVLNSGFVSTETPNVRFTMAGRPSLTPLDPPYWIIACEYRGDESTPVGGFDEDRVRLTDGHVVTVRELKPDISIHNQMDEPFPF